MKAPTYIAPAPIQQWLCDDTIVELFGGTPRLLPTRPAPSGVELSWSDFLAGAGGSSSGIELVPGAGVRMAVNHWPLAVETHNHNLPHVDHDVANVARVDPRRYQKTDMAWFSPECTQWSIAKGEKCDYDSEYDQPTLLGMEDDDPETPAAKEAKWRSRMLMRDVDRFAAVHDYRGIIVENVPDILKWAQLDRWLADMVAKDYRYKVITLNSAFAGAFGDPAPQLRDRVYFVFWKSRYRTPDWDKWLRVPAWCPSCSETVMSIYTPKPGRRRPMRYGPKGGQYFYRCPKKSCRTSVAQPYALPASSAIDFDLPTQRIGDRAKPLAPATYARVKAGLERYSQPIIAETAGHTFERRPGVRTRPVDRPMTTQSTTASKSLACPPMLVPTEGRDGLRARPAREPLRSQTTRHQDALVVPLRRHGVAQPAATRPLVTVAAAGTHHALVMRNNNGRGDQGCMSTPLDEPLRTLTTAGHQSLVDWSHLLYTYDSGRFRALTEPLPTQTTVEGDALVGTSLRVADCTLRMLYLKEIQKGMDFRDTFVLLGTANRDKVRMLGNAVTPCAARDLAACLMEAILGIAYELAA